MKKLLRPVLFALVLASFMSSLNFTVGSAAAPAQIIPGNQAVIRFDMLGLNDTLIRGPYRSMTALWSAGQLGVQGWFQPAAHRNREPGHQRGAIRRQWKICRFDVDRDGR
jgi:hypothetical protein